MYKAVELAYTSIKRRELATKGLCNGTEYSGKTDGLLYISVAAKPRKERKIPKRKSVYVVSWVFLNPGDQIEQQGNFIGSSTAP